MKDHLIYIYNKKKTLQCDDISSFGENLVRQFALVAGIEAAEEQSGHHLPKHGVCIVSSVL